MLAVGLFFFSWHTLLERCVAVSTTDRRSPDWLPLSMQTRGQYSVASNPPQLQQAYAEEKSLKGLRRAPKVRVYTG